MKKIGGKAVREVVNDMERNREPRKLSYEGRGELSALESAKMSHKEKGKEVTRKKDDQLSFNPIPLRLLDLDPIRGLA